MKLKSYAKINLTLDILRKRDDGYHEIETVLQHVELHDDITIHTITENAVIVGCNFPGLDDKQNICFKAARLMKERFNITSGVKISINKNIPAGAGLSGGSGNAAAVLRGMNAIFSLNATRGDLSAIGRELGMDVTFHLYGGTCLGRGRGEIIEPIKPLPKHYIVIVYPGFPINTPEAYSCLSYNDIGETYSTEHFIKNYNLKHLHNDFEYSILPVYQELKTARRLLGSRSLLSGSGSCVFGMYKKFEVAEAYYRRLKKMYNDVFLTHTIDAQTANPDLTPVPMPDLSLSG